MRLTPTDSEKETQLLRHKCDGGYQHYYVQERVEWDPIDPDDDSQLREIALVCARCGHCLWIDTCVRLWMGVSEDDWGTL